MDAGLAAAEFPLRPALTLPLPPFATRDLLSGATDCGDCGIFPAPLNRLVAAAAAPAGAAAKAAAELVRELVDSKRSMRSGATADRLAPTATASDGAVAAANAARPGAGAAAGIAELSDDGAGMGAEAAMVLLWELMRALATVATRELDKREVMEATAEVLSDAATAPGGVPTVGNELTFEGDEAETDVPNPLSVDWTASNVFRGDKGGCTWDAVAATTPASGRSNRFTLGRAPRLLPVDVSAASSVNASLVLCGSTAFVLCTVASANANRSAV